MSATITLKIKREYFYQHPLCPVCKPILVFSLGHAEQSYFCMSDKTLRLHHPLDKLPRFQLMPPLLGLPQLIIVEKTFKLCECAWGTLRDPPGTLYLNVSWILRNIYQMI